VADDRTQAAGIVTDPGPRVAALVARHERTLLRVARQCSLCHDDALDAYQRALEIFVRRVATVDPATEVAWLKVVVRHEAMAIRRARSDDLTGEELDLDAFVPAPQRSVEDQIASGERVRRSAEALRSLKPDEAQALMMKAHGLSYDEIGERNGWTYTKVNRAITEGRRRFLRVYEGIESGEECERFAPIVEALAAGSATSAQVLEIRPHLRHCTACRATVRDLHLSRLRRASLFSPLFGLLKPLHGLFGRSSSPESGEPVGWLSSAKQHATTTYYRVVDPTPLAGVRPGAAAAAIASCVAIGGGATYCVQRGVGPVGGFAQAVTTGTDHTRAEPRVKRRAHKATRPASTPTPQPVATASPSPEPARPTATPQPPAQAAPTPAPTAAPTPAPTPEPTPPPVPEEEYEPVLPAAATAAPVATPRARKPAPAPAQGPGEFGGP
jgi:RNA polymerase sigma factor (sigma-70 family)